MRGGGWGGGKKRGGPYKNCWKLFSLSIDSIESQTLSTVCIESGGHANRGYPYIQILKNA
jgi:hypothetical protein